MHDEDDAVEPENLVVPGVSGSLGRALSRDVVIYTVGTVVANGILYLAVPIYTRIFAPEEYSKLAFVTTVSGFLTGVLVLGGDTALARFWFQGGAQHARRVLCTTWIGFLLAWAAVVCVCLAPLAPWAASWALDDRGSAALFLLALAGLPVVQTSRMVAQVMRNQFRPVAFVLSSILLGVLSLGAGLYCAVGLDLGVAGIFVGVLGAETVVLAVRTFLTRQMFAPTFDRALLGSLLRFGIPLVPVTVSFWIFTAADRVVVGKIAGLRELGYYSVATTVTMVFVVLSGAVSQAWLPRALQLFESDRERASVVIGASLTYYIAGLGVLATCAAAIAPEVTAVLSGSAYAPAATAIPLLCMGAVAYGSQTITASGLTLMHRTGRLAAISLAAAAANVVAAVALVPSYGIVGAAGASVIGYTLLSGGYLWASQRVWRMHVQWRRLGVVLTLLGGVGAVTTMAVHEPLPLRLLVPLVFVVLVVTVAGVSPEERRALAQLRRAIGR